MSDTPEIDPQALLVEAVHEVFGERCPDYDADCMTCRVWEELDRLAALPAAGQPTQYSEQPIAVEVSYRQPGPDDERLLDDLVEVPRVTLISIAVELRRLIGGAASRSPADE